MNRSGTAVRSILDFYHLNPKNGLNDLYIIHDDLDIELGKYKLQLGVGPKIHHGLQSIYQALGTDQFWHVRVGIDHRFGDRSIPGEAYVLQNFTPEEIEIIQPAIDQIVTDLITKISG